jgi:phage terminase small subunit
VTAKKAVTRLNVAVTDDSLEFLLAIQNDPKAPAELRMRAAIAAAPYQHSKKGEQGKKDHRQRSAVQVSKGRFAPQAPPPDKEKGLQ